LDNKSFLNTARAGLAGCGTQTAGLSFGGEIAPGLIQEQQKNMMEQLGHQMEGLNTAREF
jgi:hypothetical protein